MKSVRLFAMILRLLLCLLAVNLCLSCKHKDGVEPHATVPPSNLRAVMISPLVVLLSWQNHDDYDSLVVARRDTSEWATLATLAGADTLFEDTTCTPADTFYYRVGGYVSARLFWGADSVRSNTPPVLAPENLRCIGRTGTSISLQWDDRSTNEDGFAIYRKQGDNWQQMDSAPADEDTLTVTGLHELTTYSFHVTAYNSYGESVPSNQVDTTTREIHYPTPPGNLTTQAMTPLVVQLNWENRGDYLHVLVGRKTTGGWTTIRTLSSSATACADSTVHQGTHYWYRIGAQGDEAIAWSTDTSEVMTPHYPQRPEDLQCTIRVACCVNLTWFDLADNELYYEIQRAPSGGQFAPLDSLPANTEAYIDSLGENNGHYFYRIRSVNEYGHSDWLVSEDVDYRFCNDGIIPICIGNFWQYRAVAAHDTSVIRQDVVSSVVYLDTLDYYPFSETVNGGQPDTVFYGRNIEGEGFTTVPYPLPGSPVGSTLYLYPAIVGERRIHGSDTVVVASTNGTQIVNGVTYTGLMGYNRLNGTNSYMIWIKPETVGIVRITKYNRGGTVLQSQQDLVLYSVANFNTKRGEE
jgi:hypothetical protein